MATTLQMLEQANVVTLLSTELNALANNTNTAAGSEVNNVQATADYQGYTRGKVELLLAAYTGTPTASTGVSVWFLKTVDDGTNYEDGSASVTPARLPDLVIPVGAIASGPQRVIKECWFPVGKFKPLLRNNGTGITFAATGNTVRAKLNTDQSV